MFVLGPTDLRFPPVDLASPEGLLAVGGDLRAERLLSGYRHGVFPWYSKGQPILWWSPDPRAVFFPSELKVSRSLRRTLRSDKFTVTLDTCFREVMQACAAPRTQSPDGGTWITREMLDAYCLLHEQGYAHSVEVWMDGKLVGGLYGVALGGIFFGESMFTRASDASKVALIHLVRQIAIWGFSIVDCQMPTAHLFSLGAREIRRKEFMQQLDTALKLPNRPGPWRFDASLLVWE
ncbi:MAG: leucyl/phenylalanyl-tRNA--protein transferase [Pseudomonadota bacterium]